MISVVIPVLNGQDHIEMCLKSLFDQDFKGKKEIIVVDDGSTDNTKEIVKKFNVRLFSQKNKGPAAARNEGIRRSKGSIILFTDADCVPSKDWISEMVAPFKDPSVGGVQGAYKTKQKSLISRFCQIEIEDRYEKMLLKETTDWVGTYSAAYRKRILGKGFDESFSTSSGEDPELSFRLSKLTNLVFNPRATVYHKHPESLAEYAKVKFYRAFWRVPLYKKHSKKAANDSYTPQVLKFQIGAFYLIIASLLTSIFIEYMIVSSAVLYILFISSMIPFCIRSSRKDLKVGISSLVILQIRSIVFSMGLFEGVLRRIK